LDAAAMPGLRVGTWNQLTPLSVERSIRTVQPRSLLVFLLLNSAN
jgi:hypothetical protein